MSARIWFTPEKCEGLTQRDCMVLNCATRHAFPPGKLPERIDLMLLREKYEPGMSANDLLNACGMMWDDS